MNLAFFQELSVFLMMVIGKLSLNERIRFPEMFMQIRSSIPGMIMRFFLTGDLSTKKYVFA